MPSTPRFTVSSGDAVSALRRAGLAEVSDSRLDRSLHASDASLYRIEPLVVATPRHTDEVVAAAEVCRTLGLPLTMRGAGTSIAGNAVGPGVVLRTRHLDRVLEVDEGEGWAVVEPGVVHASLQSRVMPLGWRFGPDPSTHDRCTVGGMIGNNACGSRALGYGRTADNVLGLDVVTGAGERLAVGAMTGAASPSAAQPALIAALNDLVASELSTVRKEFGRFSRQVSGYSLEHLLPERGADVARFLVGSEGTLATVLRTKVRLVRDAPHRLLVVLGYPSMPEAADAVPAILPHGPVACEGMDSRIVDVVRHRRGPASVPPLPHGSGWLFVELAGEDEGELDSRAAAVVASAGALDSLTITDVTASGALWRIREEGAGLSSRTPAGNPAHAGWEDAAVPPERLGSYLRAFDELMDQHGVTGLPYGHLGDGCLHIRIDFPLDRAGGTSVLRSFLTDAGRLAADHGGSMSGEHGDGRARSELLPLMYSPDALALFDRVKDLFDPQRLLNPGVIVEPAPADADIRVAQAASSPQRDRTHPGLALHDDRGDLSMAVHRCTGVGKCLADNGARGGVMCPSYLATGAEKDSTRGRARVLQDAVAGHLGPDPWRSPELAEVLDLCLACKGCSSDCPTGVDVAAYKSEALHRRYRHRPRPSIHYALGWLPTWIRMLRRVPGAAALANRAMARPELRRAAGVDAHAPMPRFAPEGFREWFARQPRPPGDREEVVLFVDTFTEGFTPEVGYAAVQVLEDAGYRVVVTDQDVCCGLTWVSTGQLDVAAKRARDSVRALWPHVAAGRKVVGLEPSCTAALRSDVIELMGDEAATQAAREVAAATHTLAELLTSTPGGLRQILSGVTAVAQPHCHQHAVMGYAADARLLADAGAEVDTVGGCCGLAGNFGVEEGHHDVSLAVAGLNLMPAIDRLDAADTAGERVVLADGFSCRTQIEALTERRGLHLAELLNEAGRRPSDARTPRWSPRSRSDE